MSVHMLFCDIKSDNSPNKHHLNDEKLKLKSYLQYPVSNHPEIIVSNTSPQNSPSLPHSEKIKEENKSVDEFDPESLVNGPQKVRSERLSSVENQTRPLMGKRNAFFPIHLSLKLSYFRFSRESF